MALRVILLLTFGLLYSANARPVSHEDAEKQVITADDLRILFPSSSEKAEKQELTINGKHLNAEELNDFINGFLNPSADAKEQGFRVNVDWAQKQGKRVPFGNGQTQGKTAEEQGWSVTLPGGSTYQWPVQEQGRRIPFAREQTVEGTYLNILNRLFQPSKTVKYQRFLDSYPLGSTLGWGQKQGRRVPFAREQIYWDALNRIYGIDQPSENAEKEGMTITLPNGNTLGWGEQQGIRVPYGKVQTLYGSNPNYFGHGRWFEEKAKKASTFANEQGTAFDDLFRNLQGAWRQPSAKEQMYYPYYPSNGYAKKQTYYPYYPYSTGYAEQQGRRIPFRGWPNYYNSSTVNKNKDVKDMEVVFKELKELLENEK